MPIAQGGENEELVNFRKSLVITAKAALRERARIIFIPSDPEVQSKVLTDKKGSEEKMQRNILSVFCEKLGGLLLSSLDNV